MSVAQSVISPQTKPKGKQVFIAPKPTTKPAGKPKQEVVQEPKSEGQTIAADQAADGQAQTDATNAAVANSQDVPTAATPDAAAADAEQQIERTNTDPNKDPGFIAAIGHAKASAATQAAHEPVDKKVAEAKNASHLAEGEQQAANSAVDHFAAIDEVAKQERPPITAEGFLAKFETFLAEIQVPQSEAAAKKFKRDKPIGKLNEKINATVSSEKDAVTGGLEASATAATPASTKPTTAPEAIPAKSVAAPPANIKAKAAVAKPKTDAEISMQRQSASLDDEMRNSNVTDEQLSKSQEPKFLEGLDSKKSAQKKAKEAPAQYRKQEVATLQQATGQQQAVGLGGLQPMATINDQQATAVMDGQTKSKDDTQATKARISAGLTAIYTGTKTKVTTILENLSKSVTEKLDTVIDAAYKIFEKNIEDRLDGWLMQGLKKVGSWLGLSEESENPETVFKSEKAKFETAVKKALKFIAKEVANKLNEALNEIKKGRTEIDKYFDSLSEEERKLGQDAYDDINDKYTNLEDAVYDKQDELAKGLADTYNKSVGELRAKFEEIKKRVESNWITAALDMVKGIIETIKKLRDLVMNLLAAVASVIEVIMADPIAFMGNLFTGIKQGFQNFLTNIQKHIVSGLLEWLTGTLGPMGITLPENIFSLSGIFSLLMQVLGLGWDTIRRKAVKIIPEPVLEVLEKSFEVFNLMRTKGIAGIWEYFKEKFTDIKESVLGAIKELVIFQVIEAGIKWLVSLLVPGAGFIKAIMAIKDVIVFFVQSAVALLPSVIEAILGLASGSIALVAKAIEIGLSKMVPVVISLLAKLLGLGGLAKKVTKVFTKIRKRVDRQIDKLIRAAKKKAKKFFGKKKKKGKNKNKKKKDKKLKDTEVGEEVKLKGGGKQHKIYFKKKGGKQKLIMESTPTPMTTIIKSWKADAKEHAKKKELDKLIATVETATGSAESEATAVEKLFKKANKDVKAGKDAAKKDDKLEDKEKALKGDIIKILELLGVTKNPLMDFENKKVATVKDKVKTITAAFKTKVDSQKDYTVSADGAIRRGSGKADQLVKLFINESGELKRGDDKHGEHNEYKPVITSQKFVDKGLEIKYKYEGDKHKGKEFTTLIEFGSEASVKDFSVTSQGSNVELKEKGTRGKTDSSGKIMTDDFKKIVAKNQKEAKATMGKKEIHSAHLIADWFSGSGYAGASNIVPTSAWYNTKKMFDVEKKIVEGALAKDAPFNLSVTAKQKLIEDSAVIKGIKDESVKSDKGEVSFKNVDIKKVQSFLKKEKDPQFTKEVVYASDTLPSGATLTEDKDMQKWLNIK